MSVLSDPQSFAPLRTLHFDLKQKRTQNQGAGCMIVQSTWPQQISPQSFTPLRTQYGFDHKQKADRTAVQVTYPENVASGKMREDFTVPQPGEFPL